MSVDKKKDFDYLLDKYVGSYGGPAQWRQYCLLLLQGVASTTPFYLHMFAAATPPHRCRIDACDPEEDPAEEVFAAPWIEFSIPRGDDQSEEFLREGAARSQCLRLKQSGEQCSNASFDVGENETCHGGYVYDKSFYSSTLVSELDLVCSSRRHEKFLGTVLMAGLMVGCFIGGPLGDRLGRKVTLVTSAAVTAPLVALGGFVSSYETYAVLRFFTYLCAACMWIASNALVIELFGVRLRKLSYAFMSVWYCLLNLVLPAIVYLERHWSFMHVWTAAAVASTVPFLAFGLGESVRWMAVNGRQKQAEKQFMSFVRSSSSAYLSEHDSREIRAVLASLAKAGSEQTDDGRMLSFMTMFARKYLVQTLVLLLVWISSVMSYYAVALNSTSLAGDALVNFTLSSLADIPSSLYVFLSVDRLGRKASLVLPLVLLSLCCFAMAAVPKTQAGAILALFLIGKFCSSCSMNVVWLYTAELYPTNLRAQSVALCSLVARILGAAAPFVSEAGALWAPAPFLLLGAPNLMAAALAAVFLRETKGTALPDGERGGVAEGEKGEGAEPREVSLLRKEAEA